MGEVEKFATSRKDSFNPLIDLKRCLVTCKLKKYCFWSISCRGTMIRPLQKNARQNTGFEIYLPKACK